MKIRNLVITSVVCALVLAVSGCGAKNNALAEIAQDFGGTLQDKLGASADDIHSEDALRKAASIMMRMRPESISKRSTIYLHRLSETVSMVIASMLLMITAATSLLTVRFPAAIYSATDT